MIKGLTIAILFTGMTMLASAADAQVISGAGVKDPQVCQSGREIWTPQGLAAAPGYNACSSEANLVDVTSGQQYKGIRVDPGRAAAPVFVWGNCFYIDNYTTNSFFVPAATPHEWASFVQNHPNLIELVPCCQPDTNVSDTCTGELERPRHVRAGYREDHLVGVNGARPVALQCTLSNNGRSAEWDMQADYSVPCDNGVAGATDQTTDFRVATIQGTALVRNIPTD